MAIFTCPSCQKMRNTFDKIGSICAACAILQVPNTTGQRVKQGGKEARPCYACTKWILPHQGSLMPSGRVYCFNCLNTGAWLYADAKATGKKIRTEVYPEGTKPRAHFGR